MQNLYWGAVLLLHPFFLVISTHKETLRIGRDLYFLIAAIIGSFLIAPKLGKDILIPAGLLMLVSVFSAEFLSTGFGHYSYSHVYQLSMFGAGLLFLGQTHRLNLNTFICISTIVSSFFMVTDYFNFDAIRFLSSFSKYSVRGPNIITGLLSNKNLSGAYIAMGLPCLLGGKYKKFIPLAAVAILLSDSIMPAITAVAGVFYYFFPKRWLYFTSLAGIAVIYFYLPHEAGDISSGRFLIWDQALAVFHSPLAGNGLGWFNQVFHLLRRPLGETNVLQAHNEILEVYFAFGVVGLGLLFYVLKSATRSLNRIASAGLFATFVNCLGNFTFHISPLSLIGVYYLGKCLEVDRDA